VELIILAIPLVLLWLMVSRGRKQQRELLAQQDSVTVGTHVMTTSGLFAEVVEVEADAVVLEIAPGLRTRWTKRAIGQIVTPAEPVTDSAADIRSEAGYAVPPTAAEGPLNSTTSTESTESTEGSGTTGSTGTDGR
jgi:preprotein translocase subunit YajC